MRVSMYNTYNIYDVYLYVYIDEQKSLQCH